MQYLCFVALLLCSLASIATAQENFCSLGYYRDYVILEDKRIEFVCRRCPVGTYGGGGVKPKCNPCKYGSWTASSAAKTADDCYLCAPGFYLKLNLRYEGSPINTCSACLQGSSSPLGLASRCTYCVKCKGYMTTYPKKQIYTCVCPPSMTKDHRGKCIVSSV